VPGAWRARLTRARAQVLSVGGTVVVGQAPAAVQEQMRGTPGTDVTVGFRRSGAHKKATLQRDVHF
jgi:C-terminal processing protease CtpA/Prc